MTRDFGQVLANTSTAIDLYEQMFGIASEPRESRLALGNCESVKRQCTSGGSSEVRLRPPIGQPTRRRLEIVLTEFMPSVMPERGHRRAGRLEDFHETVRFRRGRNRI